MGLINPHQTVEHPHTHRRARCRCRRDKAIVAVQVSFAR